VSPTQPLPPLERIPPQIAAVDDYEALARSRMTPQAFAYVSGGAADELTLAENVAAFRRIRVFSRVLRSVDGGDTRLELFGQQLAYPILLAPVALQKLAHEEGELATVLAASAMQAPMIVSAQASVSLEDIAARGQGQACLFMQIYLQGDRGFVRELIGRAEAAGYRALVVTVDAPVSGVRNREQRAEFTLPPGVEPVNLRGMRAQTTATAVAGESPVFGSGVLAGAPTWKDIDWLQSVTKLPVVLKGIMSPDDAAMAVKAGAAGIVVSNHGGRTLDTQPATIDALEPIVGDVDGRVPILLDGGVRRGTDVLKALALGARAVLVGRPYVYALAAAGPPGVAHVLHMLRTELEMAMVLTGCRHLADIGPEVVMRA